MNELALFAGAGGGILAGQLLGWRTVCAVERDAYAAAILAQRQNDGLLEPFPIWSDVCSFDGRPWRGVIDVVSGGFPCQDISAAGRGAGIDGDRSGLWVEMARIIGEVRPAFCFVENSPVLTSRGLGDVLRDLASLGYDAEWGVLGAEEVGAPHRRERIWIVAYADGFSSDPRIPKPNTGRSSRPADGNEDMAHADKIGRLWWAGMFWETGRSESAYGGGSSSPGPFGDWWATEPDLGRMAHGVANRVDRLRALGNGQVPQCAAEAFGRLLSRRKANSLRQ